VELVGVLRGAGLPLAPQRLPALRARERGHVPGMSPQCGQPMAVAATPIRQLRTINDKTFLQTVLSIGGLFSQVKGQSSFKIRDGDTFGQGMRIAGGPS